MPLLAGAQTPAPPVLLPGVGFATATFTGPDGTVWPLTDQTAGWFTLADGVSGLDMTPYELTKDAHPRGGSRLRSYQANERAIIWPIHVYGETHMQFMQRWRALARAFAATLHDAPGWLEIARPDGSRRRIQVVYESGFEGQGQQGTGIVSDSAVLTLYCQDPYWVDPVEITAYREYGVPVDFLDPFPMLSSGQVLGETTLTNPGDVESWPRWTITGPASLVTITNDDTGEEFVIDPDATDITHGDLLAGEQVTITTDPPRVRYQDGTNWTGALNWPGAVLWSLRRGLNSVSFQLDGASAGSRVDVAFAARYETA
jgi:hypothetical protein